MRTALEYARRASDAYEKYLELQAQITRIEEDALKAYNGNKGIASHQLKTSTNLAEYRELVDSRDTQSKIAHINAAMAQIAHLG